MKTNPKVLKQVILGPAELRRPKYGGSGACAGIASDGSAMSPLNYSSKWGRLKRNTLEARPDSEITHPVSDRFKFEADVFATDLPHLRVNVALPTLLVFKESWSTTPDDNLPKQQKGPGMEVIYPNPVLRRPKRPVYKPPKVRRFGKPSVREWANRALEIPISFQRARARDLKALDLWFIRYNADLARWDRYQQAHKARLDRYYLALSKYNDRLTKASQPKYVFKQASRRKNAVLQDHPYKYLKLIPSGDVHMGDLYTWQGGSGMLLNVPDIYGLYALDPSHPSNIAKYQTEARYPWSNPFRGVPTSIANSLLPTEWLTFDRGTLIRGTAVMWNEYLYPMDWASLRTNDGLRMLHSDFVAMGNSIVSDFDAKLTRKIYSKIKRNVVHVGNLIGERKQTFDLMVTLYKRLFSVIQLKKSILKVTADSLLSKKAWADDVLAFKFGVEPLVKDFYALADHLAQLPPDTPIITARTNSRKMVSTRRGGLKFEGIAEVSVVVKLRTQSEIVEGLKQFGLINPSEVAWELTPWSFVVDWFIPLGEYLASLTADTGLDFVTGTRKIRLRGTWTSGGLSGPDPRNPGFSKSGITGIMGTFSGEIIDRTVLTELPDRRLIATFKNPWSISHGIEALALLVQRLR